EIGDLIFQVRYVAVQREVKFPDAVAVSQFQLYAGVLHIRHVGGGIGDGADIGRYARVLEDVVRCFFEPVERHGDVPQYRRFKADIGLAGFLPFQIGVGRRIGAIPYEVAAGITDSIVPAAADGGQEGEVADVVIPHHAVTAAELQEGHHLVLRPEAFAG